MYLLDKLYHPWDSGRTIEVLRSGTAQAVWTLVMPIYNKDKVIRQVINMIIDNAKLPFDIVIIDDSSSDNSVSEIRDFFSTYMVDNDIVCNVSLVINSAPIYETACDNIGFGFAVTEFIIEIQSDMFVDDFGFDFRMIEALRQHSLASVSGRLVHSFSLLRRRRGIERVIPYRMFHRLMANRLNSAGRLGGDFGELLVFDELSNRGKIYVGDTVARGPWAIRSSTLEYLGFLDSENFFLGNDDHDFHRRALISLGVKPGYVPINVYSPLDLGSTRIERTGMNKVIYEYLKRQRNGSSEFYDFISCSKRPNKLEVLEYEVKI